MPGAAEGRSAELVARIPAVVFELRRAPRERERFPFVSGRVAELLALTPAALGADSAPLWSLLSGASAARVAESLARSEAELTPWDTEFQIRLPSGQLRWIGVSAVPGRAPDGATVWHGVLFDATERRRAQQSDKMDAVVRLAGGVAHELNNLLTAIGSNSDMATAELPPDHAARRYLEQSREAAERAAELTRELLAFGRRQVLRLEKVRWNDVIDDARSGGRLVPANRPDIAVDVQLDPAAPVVYADRGQLERVLVNLVANAVEAMPSGGRLTIATGVRDIAEAEAHRHAGMRPGLHAWLSVRDNGLGLDDAAQAHVFEPFFTTKELPGARTGLGLATVYGIVKQLDGYVQLESAPAAGTVFTVYLPAARETPTEEAPAERNAASGSASEGDVAGADAAAVRVPDAQRASPRPSHGTVLIAEDESSVREPVRRVLERFGYRVIDVPNGGAALAVAESGEAIDLLLTDLVMPGMSGSELARQVQELRPSVRVLFMSGYSSEAVATHGMLTPGSAFLQKPFSVTELVERVRETLGGASP
jgi:two-component system cell cycle sensor histidine kinase/response regulator CckA